jgi:hypothetical protein
MFRNPFTLAVGLTVAGLIPFLVPALLVLLDPVDTPIAVQVLISYGAVILSFIGAVHWGFALRDTAHPRPGALSGSTMTPAMLGYERQLLTFGVLPALLGWVALLAMIHFNLPALSVFLLLVGFFLTVVAETIGKGRGLVAGNYLILRWSVSIVVMLVLLLVLFGILSGMRLG